MGLIQQKDQENEQNVVEINKLRAQVKEGD